MEALAARIAAFCLQKHYIEPDQIAWLQYGLMRRLMGMTTFLLLLPVGAFFGGWGGAFAFLLLFRFLRTRTGGYHAKTPTACLLSATLTIIVSLTLAKLLNPVLNLLCLTVAAFLILKLAPANNASLHLNAKELATIRQRMRLRLILAILVVCVLLLIDSPIANCGTMGVFAVSVALLLWKIGFGIQ